jgi:geranylgeranyl diphosphate synthase type I
MVDDGVGRGPDRDPADHRRQAPHQLTDIAAQVDDRLLGVLNEQSARWAAVDPRLSEAVDELARMVTSGGKRLRAAFCYWAWHGARGLVADGPADSAACSRVIDLGAAFEFLQVFALIHDDIMDNSATRRGSTTIHVANGRRLEASGWRGEARRYGEGVAILVGDLGHVYADQLTGGVHQRTRSIWDELRIELNLGQYLDMRAAAAGELDYATARQVATFKTALYTIVRPLQLGASLALPAELMADDEYRRLIGQLDRFGRPLGRAFQLRDDALGLIGDEAHLGKPVGDDLREGKPTEIVSYAVSHADGAQHLVLDRIGTRDLSADAVTDIVAVLYDTGAMANNEAEIEHLLAEATAALDELPLDAESMKALGSLATYVAERDR